MARANWRFRLLHTRTSVSGRAGAGVPLRTPAGRDRRPPDTGKRSLAVPFRHGSKMVSPAPAVRRSAGISPGPANDNRLPYERRRRHGRDTEPTRDFEFDFALAAAPFAAPGKRGRRTRTVGRQPKPGARGPGGRRKRRRRHGDGVTYPQHRNSDRHRTCWGNRHSAARERNSDRHSPPGQRNGNANGQHQRDCDRHWHRNSDADGNRQAKRHTNRNGSTDRHTDRHPSVRGRRSWNPAQ